MQKLPAPRTPEPPLSENDVAAHDLASYVRRPAVSEHQRLRGITAPVEPPRPHPELPQRVRGSHL